MTEVIDEGINFEFPFVNDSKFSVCVDQKADRNRQGLCPGDQGVVSGLQVVYDLIGGMSGFEGQLEAFGQFLGRYLPIGTFPEFIDGKRNDVDSRRPDFFLSPGEFA